MKLWDRAPKSMTRRTSDIRNERSWLLTKNQYVAWKEVNEKKTPEQALADWERDKLDDDVHKEQNKRGKLVIELELPTELIHQKKTTKRKIQELEKDVEDEIVVEQAQRLKKAKLGHRKIDVKNLGSLKDDSEDDSPQAKKKPRKQKGDSDSDDEDVVPAHEKSTKHYPSATKP